MSGGVRVLIVEDCRDTREMYAYVLSGRGMHVAHVGTVREGARKVQEFRPDVIVCDMRLPDGTGQDLVRELRAGGHQMPAIALTGMYGADDALCEDLADGFDELRVKPCTPDSLAEVIDRLVARRPRTAPV